MPLWHSHDLEISFPPGIIQSGTWCLQPNTMAWPWHVPSRHPHQSHRGLPGPLPAPTSRQLVQTWREMTAKHPAPGNSRLLWGSRGWLGCVVGAPAGWATLCWDGDGGVLSNICPSRASQPQAGTLLPLIALSLLPCPGGPCLHASLSLSGGGRNPSQANVLERGCWSAAQELC